MKKISLLLLALLCFSLPLILSCSEDEKPTTPSVLKFDEIKEDVTLHGNMKSDIVIVNTQGGPMMELDNDAIKEIIELSKTSNLLYANVHQAQTKEPEKFKTDITFNEAKKYDDWSVLRLKKVVDFFKKNNKKVYVLGISFGAFMAQELIADYGTKVADGFLIMVGRLNIDDGTWKPYSEGKMTDYIYDQNGNYTIKLVTENSTVESRNIARLAAGLGFNRYTDRLKGISNLSKIKYVYATHDDRVGKLSDNELKFLKDRNATIIKIKDGEHNDGIDGGVAQIKSLIGL